MSEEIEQRRAELLERFNYPADYQWFTDGISWLALHEDHLLHVACSTWPGQKPKWFWWIERWSANPPTVLHYREVCEDDGWFRLEDAQYSVINAYKRVVLKHQ